MYVIFFILLFLIILLTFPFYSTMKIRFNFESKKGFIRIYLLGILLFHYRLRYENKQIILHNFNTTKKIDLEINKNNIQFIDYLRKEIFKRIYVDRIFINLDLGFKTNPAILALADSLIKSIINTSFGVISFQKPTSELIYNINTYYTKKVGIINGEISCGISILNVIFSIINAKLNISKIKKKKEETKICQTENK